MPRYNLTWIYFIIIACLGIAMWMSSDSPSDATKEVSYSELKNYISKGYTKDITVNKTSEEVSIKIVPEKTREVFAQGVQQVGASPTVQSPVPSLDKLDDFLTSIDYKGKVTYEEEHNGLLYRLLTSILPFVLLFGFWFFASSFFFKGSGGGVFSVGKSKAKEFNKEDNDRVLFKDVAGQEGAKQEVQEIVDFLKNPQKYTELGGKIPKGALLVGPPGTGKTLLAKAVAGEADVPFFAMSGSDFVEMFVGVGPSRVRDLFKKAKEKAPSIVFIDEIDAVGRARSKGNYGGSDERENTLNQLLTEMDGFGTNSAVIVLAATNRVDVLDQALLRAGRFDRQVHVDLPDLTERVAIFQVHLTPLKLQSGLDVELLARQTPGFSGADIANVCNEAALIAARHDREAVTMQDFLDAVDRIIGGLEKRTKVLTREEQRAIAIHEAGHASVSWLIEHANPLVKVTIVPRGQSLGAAWYLPEERSITTKEQMLDEICATLAGRAAEEVFLRRISSGALNDLERTTQRAYGMIAYLGMGEGLPNLSYYSNQEQFTKPYSEETARRIDHEVQQLINEQYERAKQILREHAAQHNALADLLCEHEVIFAADVENIFGPRPWKSRADVILEESPEKAAQLAQLTATDAEQEESTAQNNADLPAQVSEDASNKFAPSAQGDADVAATDESQETHQEQE